MVAGDFEQEGEEREIRDHAMQVECATETKSAALLLALRCRLLVFHAHVKLRWWGRVGGGEGFPRSMSWQLRRGGGMPLRDKWAFDTRVVLICAGPGVAVAGCVVNLSPPPPPFLLPQR